MAHRRSPSFFKILLDPSAPHLPLPPDFVTKHLEQKPLKDLTVQSAKGGYSWRLKIKKIGEFFCLCDGWDSVVEDIQLGFGDFLIFRVVEKSLYKMMVYSPNGCEKDFAPKTHVHNNTCVVEEQVEEELEEEENVVVDDDDDVEEEEEDDDDIVVEDDDVDVVMEDDEEEEEEVDDDDEDDDDDEEGVEYEEKDDDDDEGEGDDDGDGDGGIDGNDGDPFFMKTISKTHKTMMRLPPDFVELAGIEGEGTLTAVNVDGKEWPLGVRVEKYNRKETYCLSAGWMEFRRGNDICEGDECVFKFIRNEDKLLLARVIKSRRPARHPLGEKTENGVVKRKREQLEKEQTANGVVKRKREQPLRNSAEVPTRKVETRARKVERRAARGGAVASRGDESVKGVRRLRGKPAKQSRGTPAKQSRGTPARQSRGTPAKKSRGTPAKKSRGTPAKQSRGTPAKQSRGTRAKQSRGTPAKQSRSTPAKQSRRTPAKQSRGKRARRK